MVRHPIVAVVWILSLALLACEGGAAPAGTTEAKPSAVPSPSASAEVEVDSPGAHSDVEGGAKPSGSESGGPVEPVVRDLIRPGAGDSSLKVKVSLSKPEVRGGLDRAIIQRIVQVHAKELGACYRAGLRNDPSLRGRLVLEFGIGIDGKVPMAHVGTDTLGDASVAKCVVRAVKRWEFPHGRHDGMVLVKYPIDFKPGE